MIELGRYCLLGGLALSGYGAVAAAIAGRRKNLALARSAENSLVAAFVIVVAASACLIRLLLTDEFRVQYVAGYSASNIPTVYKFTAFWGGQSGSLLMWALVCPSSAW